MLKWRTFWNSPLRTPQQWGIVAVIVLALAFAPQITPNDWSLNTDDLYAGFDVYMVNPDYVYPPWGLILLWPYRWLTAAGSRIVTGLVIAWLVSRYQWPMKYFFAIIASPFFIFTMMFSNIDILAMIFPLLLWETAAKKRWQTLGWGFALAILLLKPQGTILVIPYLLWKYRQQWRDIIPAFGLTALLTLPISLMGSPPLLLQWLDNIRHPSAINIERWGANSVSLGGILGFIPAVLVLVLILTGLYILMQRLGRPWTEQHLYAALFLGAMLSSPYTSNQSLIVPMAFVPSWWAVLLQYAGVFSTSQLGVYGAYDGWWTLLFGLIALWFFRPATTVKAATPEENLVMQQRV